MIAIGKIEKRHLRIIAICKKRDRKKLDTRKVTITKREGAGETRREIRDKKIHANKLEEEREKQTNVKFLNVCISSTLVRHIFDV
jgi:hypothetical protein